MTRHRHALIPFLWGAAVLLACLLLGEYARADEKCAMRDGYGVCVGDVPPPTVTPAPLPPWPEFGVRQLDSLIDDCIGIFVQLADDQSVDDVVNHPMPDAGLKPDACGSYTFLQVGDWSAETITFRNKRTGLTRTISAAPGGTCEAPR